MKYALLFFIGYSPKMNKRSVMHTNTYLTQRVKKKRNINSASDDLFAVDFVDESDERFSVSNEAFVASAADEFEHRMADGVIALEKREALCPDVIGFFEKSLIAACFEVLEIV